MTPKRLFVLLLALVAAGAVAGQAEDIPIENDNQFPPETPEAPQEAIIEGSGDLPDDQSTGEEPPASTEAPTEATPIPQLEEVQPTGLQAEVNTTEEDQSCPKPCVCHSEGGSENFVVDCSGYEITEFPSPIDVKTTTLILKNNKLTEIPKSVSTLKNLKVLNAENNSIMDLALGSVSELPELKVLKLGTNRLIEYPKELKNSLSLTKLEELDLGGNDMRTELKSEVFSNFPSLQKLTLAISTPDLLQDLCATLKASLETVCTESCDKDFYECEDAPQKTEDGLIDATLPGLIPFENDENADPTLLTNQVILSSSNVDVKDSPPAVATSNDDAFETTEHPSSNLNNIVSMSSGRAMISNAPEETTPQKSGSIVESAGDETTKSETDVKVGATTTTEAKSGAVDKSVIGVVIAVMVVIVALVAIKKNWSSIRNKFSSTPRPAERAGVHSNGTAPEEVPLQDKGKSPV